MNSENIESIFTTYLKTQNTESAILLNGSWGCGKTYFWKYTLTTIAEKESYRPLYISLNGISKIETLEYQFFIRLIPFIGKKQSNAAKNTISFLTNILNGISKNLTKLGLNELFKDLDLEVFDFQKYVICFDDLERCQIPLKEVLGFINNYVEHKNLKTIILADETNIDSTQEGYSNIKEKVVGRILNFELDIRSTLPLLFKKYKLINSTFFDFLVSRQTYIVDILKEYEQVNLRIICFYFDVLERLFDFISNISDEYISEVILFASLITFEFKSGRLKSSDFKNSQNLENILTIHYSQAAKKIKSVSVQNSTTEQFNYAEIFYNRYLTKRINDFFFYRSIYTYVLTGYLNVDDFKNEIKGRYPAILTDEINSIQRLNNFRELSNEEFSLLTSKVLNYAMEGKYTIYIYSNITELYLYFFEMDMINLSKEYILKAIEDGLGIVEQKKQINDYELENLLHFHNDNPEVERIKQVIKTIHNKIKVEGFKNHNQEFIAALLDQDIQNLLGFFKKHSLSNELFPYIEMVPFFAALNKANNQQVYRFMMQLKGRYSAVNIGDFLSADYDFLKRLEEIIEAEITKVDFQQPRKYLFISLKMILNEICVKLSSSRKASI